MFRSDASFEALKLKLASVMPTTGNGSSDCHVVNDGHHVFNDDVSHPASATATVQRVSAPPPHLPSLVEDQNRKSCADAATTGNGSGNGGSISSSQESENKRKDDRQVLKGYLFFQLFSFFVRLLIVHN